MTRVKLTSMGTRIEKKTKVGFKDLLTVRFRGMMAYCRLKELGPARSTKATQRCELPT